MELNRQLMSAKSDAEKASIRAEMEEITRQLEPSLDANRAETDGAEKGRKSGDPTIEGCVSALGSLSREEKDSINEWVMRQKRGGDLSEAKVRANGFVTTGPLVDYLRSLYDKRERLLEVQKETRVLFVKERQRLHQMGVDLEEFNRNLDRTAEAAQLAWKAGQGVQYVLQNKKLVRVPNAKYPGINDYEPRVDLDVVARQLIEKTRSEALEKLIENASSTVKRIKSPSYWGQKSAGAIDKQGQTPDQAIKSAQQAAVRTSAQAEATVARALKSLDALIHHTKRKIDGVRCQIDGIHQ